MTPLEKTMAFDSTIALVQLLRSSEYTSLFNTTQELPHAQALMCA